MANSGRLSIRIPDDRSMCESIRKLIFRAAVIDGNFSEKEKNVIQEFDLQIAAEKTT
jgi:hypothetical protein